ncbi:Zinc transporter, partial [Spiromyces aspiralis]
MLCLALVVFVDPVVEWLRLPTSMQTVGSPKFMASALAFSSGIMLYTGMAVLPSEAVAFFQDANQSSILVKYHRSVTVAFFIAGILLNWVIGKVVHRITPANSTISDGCVLHGPIPADLATPVSDCRPKSSDSGNSHSHGGSNLRAYLSGSAIHSHGAALSPSIPPVSPGECSPLLHSCHTRQPKAADSSSTAGVNNVDAAASKRSRTPTLESCADMDEAHSDVAQDVIVIDSASQAYSNPSYIPVHLSTPDFAHAALAGIQTAIALSIHKLTEGFIIYSSKQASPHLGAVILVTLLVHNFPEGMTLALSSTSSGVHSHARAFAIAAGVALFPSLAGAIIALLITSPHHATQGPGPSSHIVAASL